MIEFREYQKAAVDMDGPGVLVLHWARQIGKSFALAAWAVNRVAAKPGRLVTVLSNSKDNGAEFMRKCEEVCRMMEDGVGKSFKIQVSRRERRQLIRRIHCWERSRALSWRCG
jgi:hypothetical protein